MLAIKTSCGIEIKLCQNDREVIQCGFDLLARFHSGPGLIFEVVDYYLKDAGGQEGFSIEAFPLRCAHEQRNFYAVKLTRERWNKLVAPPYGQEANHFGTRTLFDRVDILYRNDWANFPQELIFPL